MIRTVVTRGFGNVQFNGTIPLVTLRGYVSGPAPLATLYFQNGTGTALLFQDGTGNSIDFQNGPNITMRFEV